MLAELVDGCQNVLGEVSPWLGLVDRIGGSGDEAVIRFSLMTARRQAWKVAVRLSSLYPVPSGNTPIADVDAAAAAVGPVGSATPASRRAQLLLLVRSRVSPEPADVMRLLAAVRPCRETVASR